MIKFKQDGKKVKVYIEHGVFGNSESFFLEIQQEFDYQASLLRDQLQKNMDRHISKIKQEYYNRGWKDAKAKTKKRTEFYSGWID